MVSWGALFSVKRSIHSGHFGPQFCFSFAVFFVENFLPLSQEELKQSKHFRHLTMLPYMLWPFLSLSLSFSLSLSLLSFVPQPSRIPALNHSFFLGSLILVTRKKLLQSTVYLSIIHSHHNWGAYYTHMFAFYCCRFLSRFRLQSNNTISLLLASEQHFTPWIY